MSKLVSVYERKGSLFVQASHQTEAGFWIAGGETLIIDPSEVAALQDAVTLSLAASQNGVPTPPRNEQRASSMLAAAGVSSWSTFAKRAKHVGIHLDGGMLEITPYKNMGGSDGFDPMTNKAITMHEDDPGLGKAVLEALKIAE